MQVGKDHSTSLKINGNCYYDFSNFRRVPTLIRKITLRTIFVL